MQTVPEYLENVTSGLVIRHRPVPEGPHWLAETEPILARIYAARGVMDGADLGRRLTELPHTQDLMQITEAVTLLKTQLTQQGRIIVVGDYDADGATSTALLIAGLRAFGFAHVDYLIPDRFRYGYGLTPAIVAKATESAPDLLITVDNGISSLDGVEAAKAAGIAVLITDHHLPGPNLPAADAIVNPNQVGDTHPGKALAGVGVVFYVLLALRQALQVEGYFSKHHLPVPNMADFLDLVALGTVADVVPLDRINRILVYQGLQRIRAGRLRPGIRALLEVAGRDPTRLAARDLGFSVGPRLNAAGRLDDMSLGVACLLAEDADEALAMATQLDALNKARREIETDMQAQALASLAALNISDDLPDGVCLFDPSWHQGIIGILAGRLKDKLHRPVAVFTRVGPGELKASLRSIAEVHIRDVLVNIAAQQPDLLTKFGGHAMAAGLSLSEADYARFCQLFAAEVTRSLAGAPVLQVWETDGALPPEAFRVETAETLVSAGPWGAQFPVPQFDGFFTVLDQRIVGQRHLKLRLAPVGDQVPIEAIWFQADLDTWPNWDHHTVQAVYSLDINEYRGRKTLQLMIVTLAPVEIEVSSPYIS